MISFRLAWRHGIDALQRALNAKLPDDIAVLAVEQTREDFHPRFDARRRTYEYLIDNGPVRQPLARLTSWHVSKPLDVARMNAAARHLVGTHDFATFGQPPHGTNTVREVFRAEWMRDGTLVRFEIEATAFLQRMVRSLVGSLKAVGEGSWTVEQFVAALQAADRRWAGQTAPPQGLCLTRVMYDE